MRMSYASRTSASTAMTPSPAGRTISGLISASATVGSSGELRQRHDRLRQRVEIAGRLAAIAGEHLEPAHLGDHLVRGREIDRREPQAAVAVDLGEHAAGRQHHQRADIAIDAIADQHLAEPRHHRLHQHAFDGAPEWRCATAAAICRIAATSASPSRTLSTTPPTSVLCAISADSTLTATG